mgnify:CR=1 FL=1
MKATIKDVARYAGVSVATVSRYLNKSPLIAEASVEKVRGAIEALDYQPSMMARGLLHGNSKTVALAVDYSDSETYGNDYFLRIQYGLEHELSKNGYYLMICHIGGADGATEIIVKTDDPTPAKAFRTAEEEEADSLSQRLLASGDFTTASALAFLVFILLYMPCIATVAAIGAEAGWKWAAASVVYNTTLAWFVAWIVYRIALIF